MDGGIGIGGLSISKDEITSSKYDLFDPLLIEKSVRKNHAHTYRPISSTGSAGPFTFEIPADPGKFTDAETFRLHGRMRIRKSTDNGLSDLVDSDKFSTVNNIFDSLWSSVSVQVNDNVISDPSGSWYAYKAYLEKLLSYSLSTKKITLDAKGFIQDTAGEFDSLDSATTSAVSENKGYIARKKMFAKSQWVYFCSNLHIDLTTLRKVIPPNIKFQLTFRRNSDEFCLLSPSSTKYTIELEDLRITVDKLELNSNIENEFQSSLKSGKKPFLPMDRSLIKTYIKHSGTCDLSFYNIISRQQLPEQIFVAIVDEKAYRGDLKANPFNFKVFDVKEASLVVNGVHEPTDLYKLDTDSGDKVDLYTSFLENTGISTTEDRDFGVTLNDYYNGCFVLAWDRTPDKCNRFHTHEMDSGTISINLKTKTPIENTVTVLIYATYSSYIQIDEDKVITPAY